jgi:methionine sulfoxide reductase heme-binding subunit
LEIRLLKSGVFLLALVPISLLLWKASTGDLSANPIQDITQETGVWTLRFLMFTLSITPLRKLTGWGRLSRFRRMLGLFAFFYGFLHFTTYIYLDKFFAFDEMIRDVAKRPFITVGFTAFVLMIPLAATSTNRMTKWLGGKRWQALHRLVYFIALCGVIHYLWLVKADTSRPLRYGAVLSVLFLYRLWDYIRSRKPRGKPAVTNPVRAQSELNGVNQ